MAQFTIKDLARKLSISPSTVSRALRDHPDISKETKRRVMEAAERYDYRPNQLAQSLQKRRSNTIGVIVPEIRHNFFSTVISGIEEVAYEHGYTIMVCQSNESLAREAINTRALVDNRVAGLLIAISSETTDYAHLEAVIRQGVPLVQFDRVVEELPTPKVVVDDYKAAYEAVSHLAESGYRVIGHMAGEDGIALNDHRYRGYRDALRDHGLAYEERYHLHGGYREEDGRRGAARYLAMEKLPEAILAINDPVAVGLFSEFKKAGVRIPEDVALVGFSDTPAAALIDPPLTTVFQPAFEMGRTAAMLLMKQFDEDRDTIDPETVILATELRVRGSSLRRER
ncbi:substrate-binding domain-containing protein [Pseudodesulfovibrio cashew]|uniref:Substrate-binding domain-containing protein n=1 Tax=Pseudodesulfovibrio cashew TaxID=2678688 RepID=A0A6I6JFE3_9BACT|nr:LacI family DNA-binding transcriptional regulator [Pseudodesulfovibrio cashew]QGY39263.1 substrate-binding domain-containing protein [Pseudodesulfovibrio cashew]